MRSLSALPLLACILIAWAPPVSAHNAQNADSAQNAADDRSLYPVWIALAPETAEETLTLANKSYATLFRLRPEEAFVTLDPVLTGKGKQLLPAGVTMMRAPGPQFVVCEAIRQKGNERHTCLIDRDTDGDFDGFARNYAGNDYFITPVQAYFDKYDPLGQPVRYRDMDEQAEFRPVEFIIRYSHQKDWSLIDFCFEPFRRKESWGIPHLVDACLSQTLRPKDAALPASLTMHGFAVSALSYNAQTKAMTLRVNRQDSEYPITFGYATRE